MKDSDFSDIENPTFKSWRWMISDEDEDELLDEERE